MTRSELYSAMVREMDFPSAEWDNDGVMCLPCADTEVGRVLCALDVTADTVEYALRKGFDLILSHQPLIFSGIKAVTPWNPVSAALLRLIEANVAVFSFHTRLDGATDGVNDGLCRLLGLTDVTALGEGELTFTLKVKAADRTVTFTVSTDCTVLGDALLACELVEGDEGAYGLYITHVNGMEAKDSDKAALGMLLFFMGYNV